ncbi:hypothetical protein LguiA_030033 [Lonicera macranthoides]
MKTSSPSRCSDRSTSDVVVRHQTPGGRDDWMYCHSQILIEIREQQIFCGQILDSRNLKNALCILREAVELGCPQIITACVRNMVSVPWQEGEEDEEEILKVITSMGPQAEPILACLQPASAQEQLKYMLTEDDDVPLLTTDDEIKLEVRKSVERLLAKFKRLIETLLHGSEELDFKGVAIWSFHSYLRDLS